MIKGLIIQKETRLLNRLGGSFLLQLTNLVKKQDFRVKAT